jgi:predicted nicotinamide N-methyase
VTPILDRRAFIVENTRLQSPPHTPEIQLHLADEITPIWRMTEEALAEIGLPPPFWAFAWAGGQALARYVLDNPDLVAGKRVIDFATGSGLVAIAAMQAGAANVLGADIDDFCGPAVALNAAANGVTVGFTPQNLLDRPAPADAQVILAGDICYEKPFTECALAWLQAARQAGALVLIGDPGRTYLPKAGLEKLAEYQVETTRELEDMAVKRTCVWKLVAL